MFKKGDKVRHRRQITRSGSCLSDLEDGEVEVLWGNGERDWVSAGQLESPPDEEAADPVSLLLKGRHGGVDDLRQVLSQAIFSGQLSEMIYSMDATKTKFMAHQFKPVLSILDSPSQGILIADEVGLGKTIEAGLIWTELRFRKRARKLLVVCPAMLTEKWRMELLTKFGTEARIANATELLSYLENETRDSRPIHAFICSLQGLRPPPRFRERVGKRPAEDRTARGRPDVEDQRPFSDNSDRAKLARYLDGYADETQPLFDFVVIDEAHHLKNPDTSSNRLGNLLRAVCDYIALLSATPINNRDQDLYALLRVIDPAFYTNKYVFQTSLEANRPLVKAATLLRSRRNTVGELCRVIEESTGIFAEFKLAQLPQFLKELRVIDPDHWISPQEAIQYAERLEGMNLFASTISRTRKRDVEEARKVRRVVRREVTLSPLEADAYKLVTQAIRDHAADNLKTPNFMLMTPQRQMTSCMHAAIEGWRERVDPVSDEMDGDMEQTDDLDEQEVKPILQAVRNCVHTVDLASLYQFDSKYLKFSAYLKEHFSESPHDKVIVFSTFRRTLAYLLRRLENDGITAMVVQGGANKGEIIQAFEMNPSVRILLASEVASEGVDLQFMSTLVNYDLPWNPMRIEQRIGRLDRFGQKSPVINIVNLYHAGTIDERIMELLDEKLDIFQQALGGLDEIIGSAIQELSRALTVQTLTDDERDAQIQQTELALVQRKRHQEEIEAREGELIGLKDLLRRRIENAHATQATIRDKDLVDYVKRFLTKYSERHQLPFHMRADPAVAHGYSLELPATLRQELKNYVLERRLSPSRLMQADASSVVFDCTVSSLSQYRGRERITQFHPLVDFINSQVTAEPDRHYWITLELKAQEVQADLVPGRYQFIIERWRAQGIRTQDTLRMSLTNLETNSYDATQIADGAGLLNSMRSLGVTWTTVPSAGLDKEVVEFSRRASLSRLKAEFSMFRQQHEDQNMDRYRTSLAAAEKKRDMQFLKMRERITEGGEIESRKSKSQQSRIENDYKRTVSSLEEGSQVSAIRTTLALGLLQVA